MKTFEEINKEAEKQKNISTCWLMRKYKISFKESTDLLFKILEMKKKNELINENIG